MSIFKKISDFLSPPARKKSADNSVWITVKCNRCGEMIRCRVDLYSDLYVEYGDSPSDVSYSAHKLIMGEQRCYQKIEVNLKFDKTRKKIIAREIIGGEFMDQGSLK